ncbi:hypothetical protein [Paraburkholderia sp. UYCP14C]|uniref:hypothetical protein n=1 Tax=Paraburkholderia sp. UYCP14C TaxID=2511130 RepID=UPI0020070B1A|nr:hypothetical protein [Paraburkholderia sp. UYCP14C]
MDRDLFFMRRSSAVLFLLRHRREWSARVEAAQTGDVELETQQLDLIDRLVLDVRAGRVGAFELDHPKSIKVFVSD